MVLGPGFSGDRGPAVVNPLILAGKHWNCTCGARKYNTLRRIKYFIFLAFKRSGIFCNSSVYYISLPDQFRVLT